MEVLGTGFDARRGQVDGVVLEWIENETQQMVMSMRKDVQENVLALGGQPPVLEIVLPGHSG